MLIFLLCDKNKCNDNRKINQCVYEDSAGDDNLSTMNKMLSLMSFFSQEDFIR